MHLVDLADQSRVLLSHPSRAGQVGAASHRHEPDEKRDREADGEASRRELQHAVRNLHDSGWLGAMRNEHDSPATSTHVLQPFESAHAEWLFPQPIIGSWTQYVLRSPSES